ncbi:MAG: hypothetical protein IT239_06005, partial [Bacteroidia bacterium]|nr:hypothetical protein [Bacteroidia bacterium]
RTLARHSDCLPYAELIDGAVRLLNPNGCFFIILPQKEGEIFIEIAQMWDLCLSKITKVKTKHDSPTAKRMLMKFTFLPEPPNEDELVIENGTRHQYSEEYRLLTKDFYLNF